MGAEPKEKRIGNIIIYNYLQEDEELKVEEEICRRFPTMIPLVNEVAIKRELGRDILKTYPVNLFKKYVFSGLNTLLAN